MKNIVVALDIGTTKVCAIAGCLNEHGQLEILGVGKVDSVGVSRGVVANIEKTVKVISDAVADVERRAKINVKVVHVGIAGQHIKSLQHRGILTREHSIDEISRTDITRLIGDMHKLVLPPGDKIIHVIPQEFTIDNEQGIIDPIGMSGVRLEANFHIITGQITASKNIYKCVERSGFEVGSLTLEPIASSQSVLSDEEMEAGVALVDIGGGTTDLAIFYEGIIRHTAVIPFGGNVITKDIKEGCNVMQNQAEQLKVKFGSALADEVFDNRIITIPGLKGREPKEISEKNLARIIQARVEEIFDHVFWEIRRSGFERKLMAGGIVLTGGGALLAHIEKLAAYHTGMPTRIGSPVEHLAHGYAQDLSSPIYSTALGLILKGLKEMPPAEEEVKAEQVVTEENGALQESNAELKSGKWYEELFRKTKEWFEAEPDTDF
ncbi:MAG: cell division protein FtsA [Cognaticolwellia sp.]|jgi:cell division protein FtsA